MEIKLSIADDHPMIINGLKNILPHYPHIKLIASYNNGRDLINGLENARPDVLLLDIQMPDLTGDELAPQILKKYPAMKIVVLTNFDSALYANNMFKRGVHGYLLKTADNKTLVRAIETVYNNQEFIEEEMKIKLEEMKVRDRKASFSRSTLTPREIEILHLLADGLTAPQIAEKLFLSQRTVVNYRTSIMLKMDSNNVAMLIRKAIRSGIIEI